MSTPGKIRFGFIYPILPNEPKQIKVIIPEIYEF